MFDHNPVLGALGPSDPAASGGERGRLPASKPARRTRIRGICSTDGGVGVERARGAFLFFFVSV